MVELRRNQGPAICEFCLEKKNIPPGGLRQPGSGDTIGLQESLSLFQVLKREFAVLREEARRIFLHRRTVPHIAHAANRVFPFARKGEGLVFPRGKPRVLPRHCRIQLFRRFALCRWCSTSARRRRTSGVLGKRPSPTSSRRVRRMRPNSGPWGNPSSSRSLPEMARSRVVRQGCSARICRREASNRSNAAGSEGVPFPLSSARSRASRSQSVSSPKRRSRRRRGRSPGSRPRSRVTP